MVNIRYRPFDGEILEASTGPVTPPGMGEAVLEADRMPRSQLDADLERNISLDKIAGGVLVAKSQAEIDAWKAPRLALRATFEGFLDSATAEIDYLNITIPAIDTMTATQVRSVVKRLAQENLAMIKAWRYFVRRL